MTGRVARAVESLAPSGLRRFFDLVSAMEGVITLGVGEPDFSTPWHACDAISAAMERGETSYTQSAGIPELRAAISEHTQRLYGVRYDPATEILVTNGVSEALDLAFRAIVNPGDKAAVVEPSYVSYAACVTLAGGEPVRIRTRGEDRFVLTSEQVAAAADAGARSLLLSYPNNPTGAVMTREEMLSVTETAVARDLLVISDEVYDRLVYADHEHVCVPALPGMRDRTILLNGFSKTYAMTGLRLGYACGPTDLIAAMTKIHQYTALCSSVLTQHAAVEALRNGEAEAQRMRGEYARRRPLIHRRLNEMGLDCFEPRGAFYCFPSIRRTGLTSQEFAMGLLEAEKVAVIPGTAFGECGEGFVRCTYATALSNITEAMDRMERFVRAL